MSSSSVAATPGRTASALPCATAAAAWSTSSSFRSRRRSAPRTTLGPLGQSFSVPITPTRSRRPDLVPIRGCISFRRWSSLMTVAGSRPFARWTCPSRTASSRTSRARCGNGRPTWCCWPWGSWGLSTRRPTHSPSTTTNAATTGPNTAPTRPTWQTCSPPATAAEASPWWCGRSTRAGKPPGKSTAT